MKRSTRENLIVLITLILGILAGWAIVAHADEKYIKFNGKCPICQEKGEKSTVWDQGCMSTLMATYSYYDEDGNYHFEDPNITTCSFKCSNGHHFTTYNGKLLSIDLKE